MNSPYDFTGRTVLITGGTRGLGLAMAHGFAAAGAGIVVTSRKPDACERVAAEIAGEHGVPTWPCPANVSSWDECTELAARAEAETPGVDVLVNNAGLSPLYDGLADVTEALYDKVFAINAKGPFRLSALLGRRMAERGSGAIVNISSVAADHPTPSELPYAGAKAALEVFTLGLARAYAPHVRANAVVAGPFLTDIAKAWDMDAFAEAARRSIALGRAGRPDEIVGAALYLASDAASYTTGATLRVDGGVFGAI